MPLGSGRLLGLAIALSGVLAISLGAATGATVPSGAGTTFAGAFEFQGLAGASSRKGCHGEGAFGEMKPGARVLISERVASGDFEKLARGGSAGARS